MADTILKVDNINVYYGNIHAVKGVSFTVNEGEIVTLIGANGVVTRTAKRRVTEVRLTPAEKPEPEKNDDEKSHYGRMTSK